MFRLKCKQLSSFDSSSLENKKKSKKIILIYPLRQEEVMSGEKKSLEFLQNIFEKSDYHLLPLEPLMPNLPWFHLAHFRRFFQLRFIARQNIPEILVVKIPTASQLPWVGFLTQEYKGRLLIWVDGLTWNTLPIKMFLKLLMKEPILTLARMLINNAFWVKFARFWKLEIVVSSELQKKQLLPWQHQGSKIHVIPNGSFENNEVNLNKIGCTKEIPETRIQLRQHVSSKKFEVRQNETIYFKDTLVFGYIGHAYWTKGVHDFLLALEELKKRNLKFDAKFALSGRGEPRFEKIAKKKGYYVMGKVSRTDFYSSLDCLVLPLWTDWGTNVYPNVFLESFKYGVPVVTSDLGITRELFGEEKRGILVRRNDHKNLADTLEAIITGEKTLPSPEKLKNYFECQFSRDIITEKWLSIIR